MIAKTAEVENANGHSEVSNNELSKEQEPISSEAFEISTPHQREAAMALAHYVGSS